MNSVNNDDAVVKVSFAGDLRRFSLPTGVSFKALCGYVASSFALETGTELILKYTDEDGDLITISSDWELNTALKSGPLLRLTAFAKPSTSATAPAVGSPPPSFVSDRTFAGFEHITAAPAPAGLAPASAGLAPASAGLAPASAGLAPASAGLAPASAGLAPASADLSGASAGFPPASADPFGPFPSSGPGVQGPLEEWAKLKKERRARLSPEEREKLKEERKLKKEHEATLSPEERKRLKEERKLMKEHEKAFKKCGKHSAVQHVVPTVSSSSSEGEKEADKFEGLVDTVLAMGFSVKRHKVFCLLQKCDGDVAKVAQILQEKAQKAALREQSKEAKKAESGGRGRGRKAC